MNGIDRGSPTGRLSAELCAICRELHRVCSCGRGRVVCPPDEPGEPFAWCEQCEAEEQSTAARAGAGYNGWSNYETWAAALWLDNDRTSYEATRVFARGLLATPDQGEQGLRGGRAVNALAEWLKEQVEAPSPLGMEASLYSDLLCAALAAVDYREIAEHLILEHVESG